MKECDRRLVYEIRYIIGVLTKSVSTIIKNHPTYGISLEIKYESMAPNITDYNFSLVVYYDNILEGVIAKSISNDKIYSDLVRRNDRHDAKLKRIDDIEYNKDEYTTIHDYGEIHDKDRFYHLFELFLVEPRPARPINRVNMTDVYIICEN